VKESVATSLERETHLRVDLACSIDRHTADRHCRRMRVLVGTAMACLIVSACGAPPEPVGAPAGSSTVDSLAAATTTVVVPSISVVETIETTSPDAADLQTFDVQGYVATFELPADVGPDPLDRGMAPDFVLETKSWVAGDGCCWLISTIQDVRPLYPGEDLIASIETESLTWELYDSGPLDGTQVAAITTVGDISMLIASQDRFPDEGGKQSAEQLVRSFLGTVRIESK